MKRMRIISLGGLAAAALAVGLPMLPAQAQSTVIPHGYGGPVKAVQHQTQSGHAMTVSADPLSLQIAGQVAAARQATAKYAFNLAKAKADGYMIITKTIPDMGFHYLNPKITGFNVRKPQILVYEHTKAGWQLGALEWVFTEDAEEPAVAQRDVRFVPRGVPLRRRHLHPGQELQDVREEGAVRSQVHVLAPGPDHHAPLGLVPEPGRTVLEHEPARRSVQQGLVRRNRGGTTMGGRPSQPARKGP